MFDYKNAEKILEAEDVVVKFNLRGKTLTAIRGISMELYKGESLAIVGESGSGKSVFTKTFMGLLDQNGWVDSGSIIYSGGKYAGKGVDLVPMKTEKEWLIIRGKEIAMVFQDPMTGTAATMGIEENLALAKRRGKTRFLRSGITKAEREEYKELLKILNLGLEDRLTSKVGLLSGGQRQAMALLMSTMTPIEFLILDEHTAALDPGTADKVLKLTQEIIEKNHTTCLMVTHNMQQALSMGNRTLMMDDGKIVLDVEGKERENMTVTDLLEKFHTKAGKDLDNDRILLSMEK